MTAIFSKQKIYPHKLMATVNAVFKRFLELLYGKISVFPKLFLFEAITTPAERSHLIGGQAVIEGVMFRGKENWVVGVRKPDGKIITQARKISSLSKRFPFLRLFFFRGIVALIETLSLGIQAISFSAQEAGEDEVGSKEVVFSIILAFLVVVVFFVALPAYSVGWLTPYIKTNWVLNLLEGFLRIFLFVAYLLFVSRMKDVRRVFEYHGAEHKAINAYEDGAELLPQSIEKYKTSHVGCGTSFLILVLVLWILFVSFVGKTSFLVKVLLRLAVLPLVAGISYEIIRLARVRKNSWWVKAVMAPGLLLQRLTTREPKLDQLEVAIYSLKELLALEKAKK